MGEIGWKSLAEHIRWTVKSSVLDMLKSKTSVSFPCGNVKQALGYMGLELKGGFQARDQNLGVIRIQTLFKAQAQMELEFLKGFREKNGYYYALLHIQYIQGRAWKSPILSHDAGGDSDTEKHDLDRIWQTVFC